MDPEAQDPRTHHPPSRGPTEPRGPGSGKQPPGVSQPTPKHPAADTENHKYTSGQRLQPLAGGVAGRKLIQEREQFKTQPAAKKNNKKKQNRHTQSQSPTPTLMHTHKITHTQRKDKSQETFWHRWVVLCEAGPGREEPALGPACRAPPWWPCTPHVGQGRLGCSPPLCEGTRTLVVEPPPPPFFPDDEVFGQVSM
ncbi:hypothetical protein XENOCAPTIV_027810 [Xenoophorus captivus]|uniref:Uncharacterized protein n=1 Tax=Xenoophorus captivus TaxID=1517983 RepID=A0ABV0R279_9TELE